MSFNTLAKFITAKELNDYQKFVQKKMKEKGIDQKNEMGKIPDVMKEIDQEWKAKDEKTASSSQMNQLNTTWNQLVSEIKQIGDPKEEDKIIKTILKNFTNASNMISKYNNR